MRHLSSRSTVEPHRSGLLSTTIWTTVASGVGQALGVLLPIVVVWRFGATTATDSFFFAFACIALVITSASGVGQTSAVPDMVAAMRPAFAVDDSVMDDVLGGVVLVAVAGCLGAVLVLAVWPGVVGAPGQASRDALALTPFAVCAAAASVWTGVLAADRSFVRAAASLGVRWVVALLALVLLGPWLGLGALALGLVAGEGARLLVLRRILTTRLSRAPRLSRPRGGPAFRRFVRNSAAQFTGSFVLAATVIVDRAAVASLGPGSVSLLEYAERSWQLPVGLAMSALLAVFLTEWSHTAVAGGGLTWSQVARPAVGIAAATLPLAAGGWIWRHEVTEVIFSAGRLTPADLRTLGDTLGVYAAVTPVYVAGLTFGRALLAQRYARWLLWAAVLQLALKLGTNGTAVGRFGVQGIAVTTGLMYLAALMVLALGVRLHSVPAGGKHR